MAKPIRLVSPIRPLELTPITALTGVFIAVPFVLTTYQTSITFEILRYAILGMALNLFYGLLGYVNFGQVAFYGLGAYATAVSVIVGVPLFLAPFVGGLIVAGLAYLLSLPLLRTRGIYFAIATLGLAETIRLSFLKIPFLGGSYGLVLHTSYQLVEAYYTLLAIFASLLAVTYLILKSSIGVELRAIREDEEAAESMGVNTVKYKRLVFTLSGFYTALAGGVFAWLSTYVNPETVFQTLTTIEMYIVVLIGGAGTMLGPVVGGIIFYISKINLLVNYPELHFLMFGALLTITVRLAPRGIVGGLEQYVRMRRIAKLRSRRA
ncbi:MAG: branched-chain amino acid ABC transporter permease [Candidatus Caldarchaeum sp.]